MIFRDWLKGLEYTLLQGNVDVETEDVIYDSRKAASGKVFVAMKGIRADGHSFIPQVLKSRCNSPCNRKTCGRRVKSQWAFWGRIK